MHAYTGLKMTGPDPVTSYRRLVMAIAAQWVKDARTDRQALVSLAEWAEVPVEDLERRVARVRARGSTWTVE